MSISVVIGHGLADDPVRVRVRDWIAEHWRTVHCLPVTLAPCPTIEWSKGAAVNPAIAASDANIVIMADADSWVDEIPMQRAIDHARTNGWAMPHSVVKRITKASTADILNGRPGKRQMERGGYPALPGGGIVVARKDAWETVRGLDPRFVGWGGEDHALGLAMRTLVGPVNTRRIAPLWHLWHPPAAKCRKPSQASRDLDARYRGARDKPELMADLVKEW